jgi:hypothetical protein
MAFVAALPVHAWIGASGKRFQALQLPDFAGTAGSPERDDLRAVVASGVKSKITTEDRLPMAGWPHV